MKVSSVFLTSVSFWFIVFGVLVRIGGPSPAWEIAVVVAVVMALLAIAAELRGIARVLANQKKGSE